MKTIKISKLSSPQRRFTPLMAVFAASAASIPLAFATDIATCLAGCDADLDSALSSCGSAHSTCVANLDSGAACETAYDGARNDCDSSWSNSSQDGAALDAYNQCMSNADSSYSNCTLNAGTAFAQGLIDCDAQESSCAYDAYSSAQSCYDQSYIYCC